MPSETFTVELKWVCRHQGPAGECKALNLGRDTRCATCGWERTVNCEDVLPDGSPLPGDRFSLTDAQVRAGRVADRGVREAFDRGQTWVCVSCETDNRPTGDPGQDTCSRCGTPRLSTGMDRGKAEAVMLSRDFDDARAHEHDADESDGPAAADPFTGEPSRSPQGPWGQQRVREYQRPQEPSLTYRKTPRLPAVPTSVVRIVSIVGGVVLLGLGLWWLLTPHPVRVTVSATRWERTVVLKQRQLAHGSGWGDPPVGSFNSACDSHRDTGETEQCHPHQCNPHPVRYVSGHHQCNPHDVKYRSGSHRCDPYQERYVSGSRECGCSTNCTRNKNGSATCTRTCGSCPEYATRTAYRECPDYSTRVEWDSCPDYATRTEFDTCWDRCAVFRKWCEYDRYDWPEVARESAAGSLDPKWPTLAARAEGQRVERAEKYAVTFSSSDGRQWGYETNQGDWARFSEGARWEVLVDRVGGVTPVKQLGK